MDLGTDSGGIDYSLPDISDADRTSLENSIQARLKELYGPGYSDVSLSKYIVVMLTNKTGRPVVEQSLADFLDQNTAANFCSWLFSNLRSLLHRNSALTMENAGTSYPQPSRHIRSAVNLPNSDRNSQPAKDWYGNEEGDEKKPEAVFTGEEEQMGDLIVRVPMEHPHVDNNRRNIHMHDFRLPQSVRKKIIAKMGSRTKNKKAFQKEMRKEKRRLLNQQRYPRDSNRLVVTINGRPVDSIDADHPQVERLHSEKANSQNPNATFYAATPKAECAVLVKGLPPAVTNSNIRAHFAAKCGPIPRISILKRPISGEPSNLAWASLLSERATRDALSLNGSMMMRHTIHVWRKESEEAKREVHAMNKESMGMYAPPDPYSMLGFGWGEDFPPAEEEDWRSRFKYVRPQNDGGSGGGAAPVAMEVQRGPVVKEEGI
jgi:hypothetical protein